MLSIHSTVVELSLLWHSEAHGNPGDAFVAGPGQNLKPLMYKFRRYKERKYTKIL